MRTDSRPAPSFPDEGPGLLFGLKDGHFWFTHRRLAIREAARGCLPGQGRARILDFGCGDGEVLTELSRHFRAVGLPCGAAALAVPGGFILLTVPADPRLWSKFDRYAGHYRRYTRRVRSGT